MKKKFTNQPVKKLCEEKGLPGSTGRPVCMELRYACERQSLENNTYHKHKKEISPK